MANSIQGPRKYRGFGLLWTDGVVKMIVWKQAEGSGGSIIGIDRGGDPRS